IADSRLCALAMAWKSPVKCRLMSSIGTTCAYPPPAAPPFTPKTGPSDGSRMQRAAFFPIFRSACVTPTVAVDSPSPAGVGLMPVTSTSRPLGVRRARAPRRTFALYFPYSSISSSSSPSSAAISATGRSLAACAIAMSVGTLAVVVTDPLGLDGSSEPRSEDATCVVGRAPRDVVHGFAARPGEGLGHRAHERRLVAPPAMGHGREVRGVRFDQETVRRIVGEGNRRAPVLEGDHPAE